MRKLLLKNQIRDGERYIVKNKWIVDTWAKHPSKQKWFLAKCECGTEKYVYAYDVLSGKSKSCRSCSISRVHHKHGESPSSKSNSTRLYGIWLNMRDRCNNKNNSHYHRYGGRGIVVCKEWNDYLIFKEWAMNNGYKDNLTIDRIDNDGGYKPSNCQWITGSENTRKSSKGRIKSASEKYKQSVANRTLSDEDIEDIQKMINCGLSSAIIKKVFPISDATITHIRQKKLITTYELRKKLGLNSEDIV